jgi:hypothetical protein
MAPRDQVIPAPRASAPSRADYPPDAACSALPAVVDIRVRSERSPLRRAASSNFSADTELTSSYQAQSVKQQIVTTAAGLQRVRQPGPRLALAALLSASLATAEPTPNDVSSTPPPQAQVVAASPSTADEGRWLAWTAVGIGSGFLAVSAWQWVVFADQNSEAGDLCTAPGGGLARCADAEARARYVSARDDAKQARTLAIVFSGLGAAALVTGILLFPESDPGSARPTVALSADPFAREGRANLTWTW